MLKKFISICMLSLAVSCAQGPSAQQTLDVAEDALTTTCEQAMVPTTLAKLGDKAQNIGEACSAGGRAILSAQAAYAMYNSVPDANKAEWFEKMQLSLTIVRQATAEILDYMEVK